MREEGSLLARFALAAIFASMGVFLAGCTLGNQNVPPPPVPETKSPSKMIIALGDSLTAGYGLEIENAYPAQLEKQLTASGYDYRVINAGVSGDTSADVLARTDWVLQDENPSFVILEVGGNDALRGLPVDDLDRNLRAIVKKLQDKKIPVLLVGMKAFRSSGDAYVKQFESTFGSVARDTWVPLMDFLLKGVALDPALVQSDRIHPNAKGSAIVAGNVFSELLKHNLISK